jgi:hypothetical protein
MDCLSARQDQEVRRVKTREEVEVGGGKFLIAFSWDCERGRERGKREKRRGKREKKKEKKKGERVFPSASFSDSHQNHAL